MQRNTLISYLRFKKCIVFFFPPPVFLNVQSWKTEKEKHNVHCFNIFKLQACMDSGSWSSFFAFQNLDSFLKYFYWSHHVKRQWGTGKKHLFFCYHKNITETLAEVSNQPMKPVSLQKLPERTPSLCPLLSRHICWPAGQQGLDVRCPETLCYPDPASTVSCL